MANKHILFGATHNIRCTVEHFAAADELNALLKRFDRALAHSDGNELLAGVELGLTLARLWAAHRAMRPSAMRDTVAKHIDVIERELLD